MTADALLVASLDARGSSLGRFERRGRTGARPDRARRLHQRCRSAISTRSAASVPPGAEIDDRPVLQRIAARGALEGVTVPARLFDLGVPEGYRDAVSRWPARVT